MGKIQNRRKSLPCRIAVAMGAGLLAVVAGLGMAPAGAADEVSAEAEVSVGAEADVDTDGIPDLVVGNVGIELRAFGFGDLTVHEVATDPEAR